MDCTPLGSSFHGILQARILESVAIPFSRERLFPGGSDGKASAYNAYHVGDPGSIPGSEDLLEKEMATQSSILAWKIPSMVEPGRLQSMGLQRVRHD